MFRVPRTTNNHVHVGNNVGGVVECICCVSSSGSSDCWILPIHNGRLRVGLFVILFLRDSGKGIRRSGG